jgi:hypothetical protein
MSGSVTRYGLPDTDGAPAKSPQGGFALCVAVVEAIQGARVRQTASQCSPTFACAAFGQGSINWPLYVPPARVSVIFSYM